MWKFPLGVISKHLFNAGNQLYIFNQLPTAKESATLWYPFPGKRLQSCPIMFVCAFTVFIRKPHAHSLWALQSKSGLTCNLYLTTCVLLIPYIDLTHIIHMQQGKVRFVVLLTDFLLVLNLLEPRDHSRKAVKKQPFEDHMFSDNKYATNKVRLVIWSCL